MDGAVPERPGQAAAGKGIAKGEITIGKKEPIFRCPFKPGEMFQTVYGVVTVQHARL